MYIDSKLQGQLVRALVVLEVSLFAAACFYLYFALAGIIEERLYIIHGADRVDLLPLMLRELGLVVLVCGVINVLAVFIAHGLWVHQIRSVLAQLHLRMERVRQLDLRVAPPGAREATVHRLIDLCDRWIDAERRRMLAVRIAAARLPRPLPLAPASAEGADALAAIEEAAAQLQRRTSSPPATDA